MNRTLCWSVAIVVLFLGLAGNVFAQQLATLKVTVSDQSAATIAGATITVANEGTGAKRIDVTDSQGLSVIPDLPPGNYELTVEGKGFSPRKMPVVLSVGQIASLTITLGLSTREEVVQVEATVQGIDTEKSEVSQVIDTSKIADLPISGRDFIDFVLLTPSVNVGRSTAVGSQSPMTETFLKLSFGGLREDHTSFFALDGVDYTTSLSGVQRISPSQDWVQEFRVVESPYTGDNGRSLGSVVNTITKSGTNDVHGSFYEFFRNNKMDAKTPLSAPGFDTLRLNQFGATVGGPIRKEKAFYFLGYEGQRRAESPLYSSFILGTINGINQVKQSLGLKPENLSSILQIDDYDKSIIKTSYVLSDRTFFNVSYLFTDSRKQNVRGAAPGEGMPSSYRDNPVRDQTTYGSLIHVFSHLTSESLLQHGIRTYHLQPKGAGLEPTLVIPDLMTSGGFLGSYSFYQEHRFQAGENLTYTRGAHTLKFGGEVQPIWTKLQTPFFSPGVAVFPPQGFFGQGAFAAFGPGTPVYFFFLEPRSFFGQQIPNRDPVFEHGLYAGQNQQAFNDATSLHYMHTLYSGYVQDQWKARPNLSLTFGLRYDLDQLPSGKDVNVQGKFMRINFKNFQPRASFAYSFSGGKGVVRGGVGLFTAPIVYSDVVVSWVGASAFTYMNNPNLGQFTDPTNQLIGFGASGPVALAFDPSNPASIGAVKTGFQNFIQNGAYPAPSSLLQNPLGYATQKFPQPQSEQASLEIEHQIGKDLYASVGYRWLHAWHTPVFSSINGNPQPGCDPLVTSGCKQFFAPADRNFNFSLLLWPTGFSLYNAGTVSVRKALSHHFSFLVNYTFAKSIDIFTNAILPDEPENYLHPNFDRGPSDNDIRHRFTLAFLTESPKEWPIAVRDFKFSILSSLQSARYFTINTGFDTNGDNYPFSDRVGISGRNTYTGDPYYNTDIRLQRVIPFTERVKGEASVELFNIFNRRNVEEIDHVYGWPDFQGPVPRHYGDHIAPPVDPTTGLGNPFFGTPKFTGPARQVQLSFRLTF